MKINEISPLTLAFLGDAVHTLLVKSHLLDSATSTTPKIQHNKAIQFCKANAQSEALDKLLPLLNKKELDLVRRTRNQKNHNAPKNSNIEEYKKATCFEAILGYLYVSKQYERLNMLFKNTMEEK